MTQPGDPAPRYQSYLLRCWEVRSRYPDRPATWRFGLEDSETGQKHSYPNLEALLVCLQARFGPQDELTQAEAKDHLQRGQQ